MVVGFLFGVWVLVGLCPCRSVVCLVMDSCSLGLGRVGVCFVCCRGCAFVVLGDGVLWCCGLWCGGLAVVGGCGFVGLLVFVRECFVGGFVFFRGVWLLTCVLWGGGVLWWVGVCYCFDLWIFGLLLLVLLGWWCVGFLRLFLGVCRSCGLFCFLVCFGVVYGLALDFVVGVLGVWFCWAVFFLVLVAVGVVCFWSVWLFCCVCLGAVFVLMFVDLCLFVVCRVVGDVGVFWVLFWCRCVWGAGLVALCVFYVVVRSVVAWCFCFF